MSMLQCSLTLSFFLWCSFQRRMSPRYSSSSSSSTSVTTWYRLRRSWWSSTLNSWSRRRSSLSFITVSVNNCLRVYAIWCWVQYDRLVFTRRGFCVATKYIYLSHHAVFICAFYFLLSYALSSLYRVLITKDKYTANLRIKWSENCLW